jgi:hypothetical protein
MVKHPRVVILGVVILLLLSGCSSSGMWIAGGHPPLFVGTADSTGALAIRCDALFDPKGKSYSAGELVGGLFGLGTEYPAKCGIRKGVVVNDTGGRFLGIGNGKVVFFDNLPSGEYQLAEIEATYSLSSDEMKEFYDCDHEGKNTPGGAHCHCTELLKLTFILPSANALRCTVQAGEITYLGTLILHEDRTPPYGKEARRAIFEGHTKLRTDTTSREVGDAYKVTVDREAMLVALKKLREECEDCPWRNELDRQIAQVSGK